VVLLFQIKKRGVFASEASRWAQPPAKRDVAETRRWRRRPQRVRPLLASGYDTLESAAAPGRHSFLSIASGSWPLRYSSATRLGVKARTGEQQHARVTAPERRVGKRWREGRMEERNPDGSHADGA
jgi:hypothetical protein